MNEIKKGPWTAEEDQKLIHYIQKHGQGRWRTVPTNAGLRRCGKSCRLRWINYLRPDIKRGKFSHDEENLIIQLHSVLGNKWSIIATYLPGRTDNEIKNYWNTQIKKRLLKIGIDPVTHTRRLDLPPLASILFESDLSSLLAVNSELLNMATSLFLSPEQKSPHFIQGNQQIGNLQTQNHLQLSQDCDYFQFPIQGVQASLILNPLCPSFIDESQFMHIDQEQLLTNDSTFTCQSLNINPNNWTDCSNSSNVNNDEIQMFLNC
ncbi:hypothetical protein Nepgr_026817 [Nepenthes gracilis]|uniref:Uncharacterized protein n=1 Tax=Nepenthes gracilis TaxID=150966 RepID=A0AAD3Y2G6_NEPGR|nr:hypothetical protein Nepgr_026817 [Nepenthes gracilis]